MDPGYGRGRDFGPRDDYWRDGDNFGRRGGEPYYGRNRLQADYYGGEIPPAQREYRDRGRDPRSSGYPEEGYGNRLVGPHQAGGYPAEEREFGANRNQRLGLSGQNYRDDFAHEDARQRYLPNRPDDWARDDHRDEHARYHSIGPKNYKRSDERIREDVSDRLTDDPYVDASEIEVNVHNSEVTLARVVHDRVQRRRGELAAEQVSGVSHIQSNLRGKNANQGTQPSSGAADHANAPKIAGQIRLISLRDARASV